MKIVAKHDFEYAQDVMTKKSVLLVRVRSEDINLDRQEARHFVAYDVPCPKDNELPEVVPISLVGEYGPKLVFDMLHERIQA